MKKLIQMTGISLLLCGSVSAQHAVDCGFTSVTGPITVNTTFYAHTLYRLEGCVSVTSGAVLTIEPGTRVLAEKSSDAALYIAPGSYINAQGTSSLPIVFSSDQEPGYRGYGDWAGIVIGGQAYNNVPGTGRITLTRHCSISAGGTDDNDSSGIFRYVQIHHAKNGLTLASVGRKTVVSHVDVSYCSGNAFEFLGGKADAKYLVSLNARMRDFYISYGYQGRMQYAIASRMAAGAHSAAGAYGLFIENNPLAASATRYTMPVISNMTVLGPRFCNAGTPDNEFKDAVHIEDYVRGSIFNSVFEGYRLDGLSLNGGAAIANTAGDLFNCSYNSFADNGADINGPAWTGGCGVSMYAWFTGATGASCKETGNQEQGFGSTGYDQSAICASATPDFRLLSTSELAAPDYGHGDLAGGFFDEFPYRGAFDETDNWVSGWTDFNAQQTGYCTRSRSQSGSARSIDREKLRLAPNPPSTVAYASFRVQAAGPVTITLLDKVSGRPLRRQELRLDTGEQRIPVDVGGLLTGSYVLRIVMPDGKALYSQVMIAN